MTDRKKPGVAFWATVGLLVVLVGYPLSFGPACWMARNGNLSRLSAARAYSPLFKFAHVAPIWFFNAMTRYGGGDEEGVPTYWDLEITLHAHDSSFE